MKCTEHLVFEDPSDISKEVRGFYDISFLLRAIFFRSVYLMGLQ